MGRIFPQPLLMEVNLIKTKIRQKKPLSKAEKSFIKSNQDFFTEYERKQI